MRIIEATKYSIQWVWDNFGRVRNIKYSNNFSVYYAYDAGGQVRGVSGYYGGTRSDYVKNIQYDEYGSRTKVEYGNGVVSVYTYDEAMHRLINIKTHKGDSIYQNIAYTYDKVGNITTRSENGVVMSGNAVKSIQHRYEYDNLYRLTEAEGVIMENGKTTNSYTNEFSYSAIGNILQKLLTVKVRGENDPQLTYAYSYKYESNKPHAVTGINDTQTYRYDANGNMIARYDTQKRESRILWWDDENRLTKTEDTVEGSIISTQYWYDAKGMRIIKDGPYGKSVYVDTGFVMTNGAVVSNHVFVGNTRIASVVKHKDEANAAMYYYATDHLGSSSVLTTRQGQYHERIEYLPYGETWVHNKANEGGYSTPYRFTSKELDPETGWYYYGFRYYDPKIGRWISTDPALEKFLPTGDRQKDKHLPAGGIFRPTNLSMYIYTSNNPIVYIDPDGKWDERIHFGSRKYEGTLQWAQEAGFSRADAAVIAGANSMVDYTVGDNPLPIVGNQGRHFNVNESGPDSRILYAFESLQKAISYETKSMEYMEKSQGGGIKGKLYGMLAKAYHLKAMVELGKGLHSLQDVYAHTEEYTKFQEIAGNMGYYYHETKPNMADDPETKPARREATKEATKIYLMIFKKSVEK